MHSDNKNNLKKIWFVSSTTNGSYGGGHSFLERLIDGLDQHYDFGFIGPDPFFRKIFQDRNLSVDDGKSGFEPVIPKNLLLFPVSILMGLWFFIRHYQKLKNSHLIVFNASFTEDFFLLPWLKIFLKKKVIHMRHGGKCPTIFAKTFVGKILIWLWGNDPVTFVSNSQLQEWKNLNLIPKNPIMIYNGVPVEKLQIIKTGSKSKTKLELGFLGRLEQDKGLDLLFQSLQDDRFAKYDLTLKIAGDGSLKNQIYDWKDKIRARFEHLGYVQTPTKFLSQIDVLIVPSLRESFGLVVCEAWERGKPVICSNIPVFRELKESAGQAEKSLMFNCGEVKDLTDKLLYFLENHTKFTSQEHQEELHNLVLTKFSVQNMITKYARIFS